MPKLKDEIHLTPALSSIEEEREKSARSPVQGLKARTFRPEESLLSLELSLLFLLYSTLDTLRKTWIWKRNWDHEPSLVSSSSSSPSRSDSKLLRLVAGATQPRSARMPPAWPSPLNGERARGEG